MCDLKGVMVITYYLLLFWEEMHVDTVVDVIHLYFSRAVGTIFPS